MDPKAAKGIFRNDWVLLYLGTKFWIDAKPLCVSLKGSSKEPLNWTSECQHAFEILKNRLTEALALGLPDLQKPFHLYVHERKGIWLGS